MGESLTLRAEDIDKMARRSIDYFMDRIIWVDGLYPAGDSYDRVYEMYNDICKNKKIPTSDDIYERIIYNNYDNIMCICACNLMLFGGIDVNVEYLSNPDYLLSNISNLKERLLDNDNVDLEDEVYRFMYYYMDFDVSPEDVFILVDRPLIIAEDEMSTTIRYEISYKCRMYEEMIGSIVVNDCQRILFEEFKNPLLDLYNDSSGDHSYVSIQRKIGGVIDAIRIE